MSVRRYIVPAVIATLSLVVIWASYQLERSPPIIVGDAMQPRQFPIFLMVVNLILVAVWTVQLTRAEPEHPERERRATWGTVVLLVLFYPLATYLDLFIGIAVVMFVMSLLWGERRVWVAAAIALATPLLVFVLFDQVLQVRFPRGLIIDWYYG